MFFQRIKTPGLAHNAYLLGSNAVGILIDPRRDIEEYLELAAKNGIAIKYVLETHRQEDFILGSAAVKEAIGAKIIGGHHKFFHYCDIKLKDGETLEIEDFTIKALHTPGHTPESMSYAFYMKGKEDCWAVFTGDALFIGEAGRTDLPDKDKTGENAGLLYDVLNSKILPLGPQTLLYPAHGSGSVCGGNIAEYDESTLGLEATFNPAFTLSREEFIEAKLHERIPRPPYFTLMEELNLNGGVALKKNYHSVRILRPQEFAEESKNGIIIDTRLPEAFAGGHIPGSYSIWLEGLPVFGGYIAEKNTKIYLVLERPEDIEKAYLYLTRIGMDRIVGAIIGNFEKWRNAGLPIEMSGTTSPVILKEKLAFYQILDVREVTEYEDEGHIPGALHSFVGSLGEYSEKHPITRSTVVTCSVGHRASLAVSILLKQGYKNVSNLLGGMTAWQKLKLPTSKKESEHSFFYENINSKPEFIENQIQ
ncbi:MAG: rhodanese-like domain-containing protein [Bacteriovoracaceae bacterium]|nr:rhodanese-like domain-containing protein [Bacteriovoracaceae bacterium]